MVIYKLGQSILRTMDPETAHVLTIRALKTGLMPAPKVMHSPVIAVTLPKSGLELTSPVGLAAGFDKNADVPGAMSRFGFGLVECGTVTPKSQPGNPKPRLFRLTEDQAVINRMGFNNEGLPKFEANLKTYTGAAKLALSTARASP